MTANEAIERYTKKFGGFPYLLFNGADLDDLIVSEVEKALRTGREIEAPDDGRIY